MSKIVETVTELLAPTVEALGYGLIDVEYKKESVGMVLTLYIDKEGGVGIEDCEAVSRAVDPILDEHDPIPQSYCLSVSSPGLDRPLKTDAALKRKLGTPVVVKLFAAKDGQKEWKGTLLDFDEDTITLQVNLQDVIFSKKEIAVVKPWIQF